MVSSTLRFTLQFGRGSGGPRRLFDRSAVSSLRTIRLIVPVPTRTPCLRERSHDEFLGARVEITFSKWERIDGVEGLAQLGDAYLDHPAVPRDHSPAAGDSASMCL